MEIERKFTVKYVPDKLQEYKTKKIEQAYLCDKPTVRIRKSNTDYILTYKSKLGLTADKSDVSQCCEEVELPLTEEAYLHLKSKADGNIITKTRYIIPYQQYKIELDIFEGCLKGLVFAEVEFPSEKEARDFVIPEWFDKDVTFDKRYKNTFLSKQSDLSAFEE